MNQPDSLPSPATDDARKVHYELSHLAIAVHAAIETLNGEPGYKPYDDLADELGKAVQRVMAAKALPSPVETCAGCRKGWPLNGGYHYYPQSGPSDGRGNMTHSSGLRIECAHACRCETVLHSILGTVRRTSGCPFHSDATRRRMEEGR